MTHLTSGFLAEFVATAVLSVLMVGKSMMGIMREMSSPC